MCVYIYIYIYTPTYMCIYTYMYIIVYTHIRAYTMQLTMSIHATSNQNITPEAGFGGGDSPPTLRPISLLRLSLLRFLGSSFPANSLWA